VKVVISNPQSSAFLALPVSRVCECSGFANEIVAV